MSKDTKYYLYRHVRLDTNQVFHVSIETKTKYFSSWEKEYRRAYSKSGRNPIWNRIAAKAEYDIEILWEANTRGEVERKEIGCHWSSVYYACSGYRNSVNGFIFKII